MKFHEYISTNRHLPFEWGKNDCVLFAARWVHITTGRDPLAGVAPWENETGARRAVLRVGGLEKVMDQRFRRINPNFAMDGDLAIHQDSLRLYSGDFICSPGEHGLVFFPRLEAKCAWRCL